MKRGDIRHRATGSAWWVLLLSLFGALSLALVTAGGLGLRWVDSRHWAWMTAQSDLLVLGAEAQWSAALDTSGSGARDCLEQRGVWDCRSVIPRVPREEAMLPGRKTCQCTVGSLDPTLAASPAAFPVLANAGLNGLSRATSSVPKDALAWTRIQALIQEAPIPPGADRRTVLALQGYACLVWPQSTDALQACPGLDAQTAALGITSRRAPGGTPWVMVRTWQNRWHRSVAGEPPVSWEETIGHWRPGW